VRTGDGWLLRLPLPDGRALRLQAPARLTADQVVAIAAQTVVTPRR
jgi:hypothetical protein